MRPLIKPAIELIELAMQMSKINTCFPLTDKKNLPQMALIPLF